MLSLLLSAALSVSPAIADSAAVTIQDTLACEVRLSVLREEQTTLLEMGEDMRYFALWLLDGGCSVDTVAVWYAGMRNLQKDEVGRRKNRKSVTPEPWTPGCKIPEGWTRPDRRRKPDEQ